MAEQLNGILYPQDFVLLDCRVVTALGQPLDIKPIVAELNLFEDLYAGYISGNMVISDSHCLLNNFCFTGNEYLIFSFGKPGLNNTYTKTFRVYKVDNRRLTQDQNEIYVLHFCSEELVLSEQYKISKSYVGNSITYIVGDILQNILQVNSVKLNTNNIETTRGLYEFIIPNMKPLEALSWLSTYAISASPKTFGSPYLFFENKDGFNFKSLQALVQGSVTKNYLYRPKNLNDPVDARIKDLAADLVNVLAFEHLNNFDIMDSTMNGTFSNHLLSIDTIRRQYTNTDFDYNKYVANSSLLNKSGIMSNAQNRFGDSSNSVPKSVFKMVTTNTGQGQDPYISKRQPSIKDINVETFIPYRTSQIAQMNTHRMRIVIPGDPTVKVGDIINFLYQEVETRQEGRIDDRFYSGNFLITAIRHQITQENKFQTLMEISKESSPTPLVSFDNASAAWKNLRAK